MFALRDFGMLTMFRQASNRYQRSKGFKVKHAFQIALLAAVSIWLLYQVKHSHDKRHTYDEKQTGTQVEVNAESAGGWNGNRFGRKGKFEVFDDGSISTVVNSEKNEGNTEEVEIKDLHTSSEENGHQDQGVGDDEIDGHEEEKTEEGSQEESEKAREKAEDDDGGKVVDAEEEEQNGDVGTKFVQIIKQETESTEETPETKGDHNENEEETQEIKDGKHDEEEDKNAEKQSENEHHEGEDDNNAEKQSESEHHEGEEDSNAAKQSENEHQGGEEDDNAKKQSENELHEGEEDKNGEKQSENEQYEGEEVKNAKKQSENEHHEGEEDKNAEKQSENEHHEGEDVHNTEKQSENEHHERVEVNNAEKQSEIKHHGEEEDKDAEKHSGNKHEIAPLLELGGQNVRKNSTESVLIPNIVLKENETVTVSPSQGDGLSVDQVKTAESAAFNSESVAVDGSKDTVLADSNAKEETEKLEGKNQQANMTSTISYSDSNAEKEHERLEENRKEINSSVAEDHEMEQRLIVNHEIETETRKELDELATSESKIETENTSQTMSKDIKSNSNLDQGMAEDEARLSNEKNSDDTEGSQNSERSEQNLVIDEETSSKTDDASEGSLILDSSERNSATEAELPDGGDATSQDMPGENEAGDRTDLGTLPQSETEGQNSEEISAQ